MKICSDSHRKICLKDGILKIDYGYYDKNDNYQQNWRPISTNALCTCCWSNLKKLEELYSSKVNDSTEGRENLIIWLQVKNLLDSQPPPESPIHEEEEINSPAGLSIGGGSWDLADSDGDFPME